MRKASYDGEPGSAVRTIMRCPERSGLFHMSQSRVWIDGASHNDLYYKKQYVDPSVEKLTSFFTQNLSQTA